MSKEFSYQEVAAHKTKRDLYIIVHDKVYDASKFVDEHPGGEEVLVDVGGTDATEAFEDVGHSDEARELLSDLCIGTLKRSLGDPAPRGGSGSSQPTSAPPSTGLGVGLYAVILLGGAAAYVAYQYMMA